MEFVISFDMRAPTFGAPKEALYRAALDMAAWADELGFNVVSFGEHHASEDGYLPSPLPLAAAVAARTKRAKLRPNVLIAPLYEPVKLAEDLSVIQILSGGRLQVVLGAGYRPYEFEMFGTRREERKERYLAQLRAAGDPSLLVAACDKRHNLGELVWDLRHEGPGTLDRFNAGPDDQLWYFESLHEICRDAIPGRLAMELEQLVSSLRELLER